MVFYLYLCEEVAVCLDFEISGTPHIEICLGWRNAQLFACQGSDFTGKIYDFYSWIFVMTSYSFFSYFD